MEAVGIGDLHLTDVNGVGGLYKYLENPCEFVRLEVERVLAWAIRRGIVNIILYGDICENPRMSYEGHLALITIFKNHPTLKFFVLLGNHDKMGLDSKAGHSLEILVHMQFPNVTFITEETTMVIDKAKVHFMPWPCKKFHSDALNIAHIEVRGSKTDSGRSMDSKELAKPVAFACIGHLHTSHRVKKAHYSGTLYQTNFGEGVKKYFHHIKYKNPENCSVELIPHEPKYKLYTVIVHSKGDLKSLSKNPCDLIKLVIEDGADIVPSDYDQANVVVVKAYKSKTELETILAEDLSNVEKIEIRSTDFFNKWISVQDISPKMKKRASKLRESILNPKQ